MSERGRPTKIFSANTWNGVGLHQGRNGKCMVHVGMIVNDGPKPMRGRHFVLDMTPDDAERLVVRLTEYIKRARDNNANC